MLSLFTGAGALDQGFHQTGRFKTKLCIEYEAIFCKTLAINQPKGYLPRAVILNQSVPDLDPEKVRLDHFGKSAIDGLIGGPPCETFSVRGKKKGMNDPKGSLVFTFIDWAVALKPRFFLMENVPPLAKLNDGDTLKALCERASSAGYAVSHTVLNAADYGAPTSRRRLIVVGILGGVAFRFPDPTHSNDSNPLSRRPYVTSGDALAGLPEFGWIRPGVPQGHVGIRHTPTVVARFAGLKQGQQDNIRKRTRLHLERPCPTLVAGNLIGIRSHIHPTEPRELTNRESARLHGFDDEFEFAGSRSAMGKQIANSVPIALARALGQALAEHLDTQGKGKAS